MIFHSHANKTHCHKKGCALGLVSKVGVFGTWKWPIDIRGQLYLYVIIHKSWWILSSQTQGRRWGFFPKTCLLSHEKKLMFLGEYFVPCWLLSVAVFKEIKYICGRLGVLTQPNKMYFFSFSTTSPVCSFCWDFYTSRRKTVNSKIFVRTKEYEMNCTFFCWNLIYEVSLASKLLITITVTAYLFSFKFDLNE